MAFETGKLKLQKNAYRNFIDAWISDGFKGKKFGEAFYDYFRLSRVVSIQDKLVFLKTMDRKQCEIRIKDLFDFK